MKKRIKPSLIIVFGKMIEGMEGKFLHYEYKDCFMRKKDYEQLRLFPIEKVFTLEGGEYYG